MVASECPERGSENYRNQASLSLTILSLLTLGIAGIIFPPSGDHRDCIRCGHRWEERP